MTKVNKIYMSIMAIVVAGLILGIGIFVAANPIFAEEKDAVKEDSLQDKFVSRVASILGIDENNLTSAMEQAGREIIKTKLDEKVKAGSITQDQADKYYEWHQAKPKGFIGYKGFGGYGMHKKFGGWHGKGKGLEMKKKDLETKKKVTK